MKKFLKALKKGSKNARTVYQEVVNVVGQDETVIAIRSNTGDSSCPYVACENEDFTEFKAAKKCVKGVTKKMKQAGPSKPKKEKKDKKSKKEE